MAEAEEQKPSPPEGDGGPPAEPEAPLPEASEQAPAETPADEPPAAEAPAGEAPAVEAPPAKPKRGHSLAIASTLGLVLAAMVFQNLWQQAAVLFEESKQTTGALPLIILGGVAGLVALAIVGLILWKLGRLLLSVRMTVALLAAVAVLGLLSLPFEPEGEAGLRGAASLRNEINAAELFSPLLGEQSGKRAGEKVMILARTAGLTDLAGSWALYALLGLLALSSAAALGWRRPVGAREFGFIAAHAGVLLLLGGTACGAVFGYRRTDLRLGIGGAPRPVPGTGAEPAFSMSVVNDGLRISDLPPRYRVLAWSPGEQVREMLPLDGSRPGKAKWRGMDVEVLEFRPRTVAEEVVEDKGRAFNNPAVRVEILGGKKPLSMVLYAYSPGPRAEPDLNMQFRYYRLATAQDATAACRRRPQGEPEKLAVISASGRKEDEVELPFANSKVGSQLVLQRSGVRLEVLRWYSGAVVRAGGRVVRVPPRSGTVPAMELRTLADVGASPDPGEAPASFWVIGGEKPTAPVGKVPPQLKGKKFLYNPVRWQPISVRVVEGPHGSFSLAELLDGKVIKVRAIKLGEKLDVEGGRRLRLVEFIRGAQRSYKPREPRAGERSEPAVHLAVGEGMVLKDFWFFPGRSGPHEVLDGIFVVRAAHRGRRSEAVEIEVFEEGSSVGTALVERGRPFSRKGYTVYLTAVEITGRSGGRDVGLVSFTVGRRPGLWVVYAGMVLLALGAPWLLWSRFRQVPDAVSEES